jgi:hypothetical protein
MTARSAHSLRAPALALLALLALLGAQGCPTPLGYDSDGDGSADRLDCGPSDPLIYPGAPDLYGDGVDQNCDDWDGVDQDGDGWPAGGAGVPEELEDCNDDNPAVHPEAEDVPGNQLDEDCDGVDAFPDADGDGTPDEQDCDPDDPVLNELDLDGDGWSTCEDDCDDADPAKVPADQDGDGVATCDEPADCDGQDGSVWPGAAEVCDGVDTDCDGALLPEEVDADADGIPACAGDCDDLDPRVFPGQWEPIGDGLDEDCDGNDATSLSLAAGRWQEVLPEERDSGRDDPIPVPQGVFYPARVDQAGDVDGDGLADLLVGVSSHPIGETSPGDAWLILGSSALRSALLHEADLHFTGAVEDQWVGASVAGGGDVDGDGLGDVLIGQPGWGEAGRVRLVRGDQLSDLAVPATVDLDGASLTGFVGASPHRIGGPDAAFVGDVDGDGLDDVAVCGVSDPDSPEAMMVAIFAAASLPASGGLQLSEATVRVDLGSTDQAGPCNLGSGDFDGDGLADLVVGTPYEEGDAGWSAGSARMFLGTTLSAGGVLASDDADWTIRGLEIGGLLGAAIAGLGDLDGDGLDELTIGAPNWSEAPGVGEGAVILFAGAQLVATSTAVPDDAALMVVDVGSKQGLGERLVAAGDVDGDGLDDLAATGVDVDLGDHALLFTGADLADALAVGGSIPSTDATAGFALQEGGDDPLSIDVTGAGDVDGDGRDDLLFLSRYTSNCLCPVLAVVSLSPW